MRLRILLPAAILVAVSVPANAQVREVHVQPLSAADGAGDTRREGPIAGTAAGAAVGTDALPSETMTLYPIGGTIGRDVVIPYYVDLDPSAGKRDWNCGDLTFNGHSGHDPYVRSFAEQRIGVPVFAVRDGMVVDVRDGEPDENITNDPSLRANYVTLRHDDDEITQYVHLRKGILVAAGAEVTAGTQIGWVGSSGMSTGPHLHFEARIGDEPYEPMAGPCRPGGSSFADQPPLFDQPMVFGATFSNRSFGDYAAAPMDDAPHTGTFVQGSQAIYFKAEVANVGASTRYRLMLDKPGSTRTVLAASGTLTSIDTSLASIWWGLDVNLDRTGTWAIILELDERRLFSLPFTVVSTSSQIVNRAPNPVSVSFEPHPLRIGQAAVCRSSGAELADADYDVVRYRYEWRVNGALVRDVTSAAQSDALPHQFMTARANVSCSVTASDGLESAPTVTAHGEAVPNGRRRTVRR